MVTEEQLQTILKVVNRTYHKYIFGYFDADDIKQQATMIGLKAVEEEWDGIRPLENFLSKHIPNRLKNFKRDNYFRLDVDDSNEKRSKANNAKRGLMEPGELFDSDITHETDLVSKISTTDTLFHLKEIMPPDIRADYHRLLDGVSISKARKEKVYSFIRDNIDESQW